MRDRKLTHEQILTGFEREQCAISMENERERVKLRAELVEKYTEEGVQKVEAGLKGEDFISKAALTAWEGE
jgi:hypothetical protein